LTVIIAGALGGLAALGYHAVDKWAEGLKWKRLGEFAEVAEQIRQDVKRKLDEFRQTEEERPYTDYQYYYAPEQVARVTEQLPLIRSPLGGSLEHGLAYGHFRVEPDGRIITANDDILQRNGFSLENEKAAALAEQNKFNVRDNLMPVLGTAAAELLEDQTGFAEKQELAGRAGAKEPAEAPAKDTEARKKVAKGRALDTELAEEEKYFRLRSLERQEERGSQRIAQRRDVFATNVAAEQAAQQRFEQQAVVAKAEGARTRAPASESAAAAPQTAEPAPSDAYAQAAPAEVSEAEAVPEVQLIEAEVPQAPTQMGVQSAERVRRRVQSDISGRQVQALDYDAAADIVEGRIEPFVPIVVGGEQAKDSIFGGQVFLVRRVEIENRRFWQGFKLNEKRLLEEVRDSARRFVREGMGFEILSPAQRGKASNVSYAAILDFGFGELRLNLREDDPQWAARQIVQLRNWYLSIVAIVFVAAGLGLVSLWRYAHAQVRLVQKKDDFISAVSHELRTPLTSIRMYSEMLEKNWVKSQDKVAEYYRSMRQESERLSRLIENVLDFSRIQRGRKKYAFSAGDLYACVAGVVEMMRPYAEQNGFAVRTEFEQLEHAAFDGDAVKQIVVNLLDNAVKYARDARDKTITVRTKADEQFVFIEVEDHGPGVPHRQRKRIFEEFYRIGSEDTRETAGTGLGLALVKKFAEAHNGFVEILSARPAGAIFRVGLAVHS
jgi:signal transduction histidine kinase